MNADESIPPADWDYYEAEFAYGENVGGHCIIQSDGRTYRPPHVVILNSGQFVQFGENGDADGNLTRLQDEQEHNNAIHDGTLPVASDSRDEESSRERSFVCEFCGRSFCKMSSLTDHLRLHTGHRPFLCEECGKSFATREGLRSHMICHSQDRRFECDLCGKKFLRKQSMQHHRLIHTGEKPFACGVCQKAFSLAKVLKDHMRVHTDDRPHPCDECGKRFKRTEDLRKHKQRHSDVKRFLCESCPMRFLTAYYLRKHQRVHNGVKPYHCEMCPMRYSNKDSFVKHLRTHDAQSESQTVDLNIDANTGENNPRKVFVAETRKPHLCVTCREEFSDESELEKHRLHHKREKPFLCLICGVRFFRSPNLKIHLSLIHAQGSDKKDLRFKFLYGVSSKKEILGIKKKHLPYRLGSPNQRNSKEKPSNETESNGKNVTTKDDDCFTCELGVSDERDSNQKTSNQTESKGRNVTSKEDDCFTRRSGVSGERNSKKKTLNQTKSKGKNVATEDDERFTCRLCDKTFRYKTHLQEHFKTHIRERELLRSQGKFASGKRCKQKYNLLAHSSVHSRPVFEWKRTHKCTLCSKRFYNENLLRRHTRVHSGERSFSCPVCHKSYTRSDVLIRHCRYQHTEYYLSEDFLQMVEWRSNHSPSDEDDVSLAESEESVMEDG